MNVLWLLWAISFFVLEGLALLRPDDSLEPLTYWLTNVLFPLGEIAIAVIVGFCGWLTYHLIRNLHRRRR